MFKLKMIAYCGVVDTLTDGDLRECRVQAAHRIRTHRDPDRFDYPVTTRTKGWEWELESDPLGESMISDNEGWLRIVPYCDDCGAEITFVEAAVDGSICETCIDKCERCGAASEFCVCIYCHHCGEHESECSCPRCHVCGEFEDECECECGDCGELAEDCTCNEGDDE